MTATKDSVHLLKLPRLSSGNPTFSNSVPQEDDGTGMVVSASHPGTVTMDTAPAAGHRGDRGKFPKIVLRDVRGRELDTDTSYQQAIYEAKWKLSQGEPPVDPEEWRLPHGPTPARPDYSRTAPPFALKRLYQQERRRKQRERPYQSHPGLPEGFEAEKDYAALRWSLQQAETLPPLVAASLLSEAERGVGRTYLPFVGVAPVVNRPVGEVDRRETEYVFPGFCYGCSRGTGLCYGCQRDTRPHFHYDKPFRTGGGFAYFKRDKIIGEILAKNPANWRVSLPAPRGLPPTAYVFYDEPPYPEPLEYGVRVRVRPIPEVLPEDTMFLGPEVTSEAAERSRGSRREVTFASTEESGLAVTYPYPYLEDSTDEQLYRVDVSRMPTDATKDQLMPTLRERSMLDEEEDEEDEDVTGADRPEVLMEKTGSTLSTEGSGVSKKSRGLYKPPKAFKLKSQERRVTLAEDPFSKDRVYDIPTGGPIQIHKSDKKLTEFDEFIFGEGNWEEPKPFEFKDRPETVPEERTRPPAVEPPRKAKTDLEEIRPREVKPTPSTKDSIAKPKKEEPAPKPKAITPPKSTKATDEGVSLHPLVQQLETPPVPTPAHDTLIRLPSVGKASSATTERSLATPHEPPRDLPARPQEPEIPYIPATAPDVATPSVMQQLVESPPSSPGSKKTTPPKDKARTPPRPREPETMHEPIPEVDEEEPEVDEEPVPEEQVVERPKTSSTVPTPPDDGKPERKQRVVVKKERKKREPPVRRTRRETDQSEGRTEDAGLEFEEDMTLTPEPEREPTPEPEPEVPLIPVRERRKLPTPPPMRRVAPPPLPRAIPAVPPLPREYTDPDRPVREVSQTLIEAPPPMFEPPKQRRPPPPKRPKTKPREFRLPQVRTSDTPATRVDQREVMDPLDYLAKYCIIHKDRLPLYERVFRKVVKEQNYRYVDVPHTAPGGEPEDEPEVDVTAEGEQQEPASGKKKKKKKVPAIKAALEPHEERMIEDMTVINRSTREEYAKTGYNIGDQNVSKVHFTLDILIDKYEELQEKHDKIQGDRIMLIADIARSKFPDVAKLNYKPKGKKTKKGKKKKAPMPPPSELLQEHSADVAVQTDGEEQSAPSPRAPRKVTDVDIVGRLSKKMMDEISGETEMVRMNLEITRFQEKLRDVDDRIEDLEDEKKVLQLYSRDEFQKNVTRDSKPEGFMRQQSALYRKMHQQNDEEMNVSELGEALQQINGHLITDKELQFIFHILDIPGRRRVNLQLFSVIAALSEKVRQVDPFIRKLINKFDYEALNVKMDKSKELFWLLDEQEEGVPSGKVTSSSLAVELAAGGVTPEHTQYVVNKFSRENKGIVDFMDFLTYVPLFIEIHGRIVDDPLSTSRVF